MAAYRSMTSIATHHRFALTALAWSIALFAAVRLSWIDLTVVAWLIETQRDLALWYGATPTRTVIVDASCSGADVIALCLAVTFAYPVAWRQRLLGAMGGVALILVLNTARIGTLFSTASQPALFNALHLYVWPAALILATGLYVLVWTARTGAAGQGAGIGAAVRPAHIEKAHWHRFGLASVGLLVLYAGAAPWTMTSAAIARAGVWTAGAAGQVLSFAGISATATGNVLATSRGAFQVTQECLLTPLVPIYLAAAIALPMRRRTRAWLLIAALPAFFLLGIIRVLVLALPPALVASPIFVAHGFYQLVTGAALIGAAAWWALSRAAEPARRSQIIGRSALAMTAALGAGVTLGDVVGRSAIWLTAAASTLAPHALTGWALPGDLQGALPLLPAYQVGLFAGLWCALAPLGAPGRLVLGLAVLALLQSALLVTLGETALHLGLPGHPLIIRALAIALPATLAWLLFRPRDAASGSYDDFWHGVGTDFPDLAGAASTALYRGDEIRLLSSQVPAWRGLRVLKTDLWDEARNTRILQWVGKEGADVHGIDISAPTIAHARREFGDAPLRASRADVRELPFADASFDVIYSMGTIEHFDESDAAVGEMARVLKPGGRAIIGVPNRFDPFLRPVLVWFLWVLGRYGYGFEKSYSRRALRRLVREAGLDVADESSILFIPGWLRMLDLFLHTRRLPFRGLVAATVRMFEAVGRRVPWTQRHGYLITVTAIRPGHAQRG